MQDKELTYENLAPLYILNKELEETPDPFRLQGDKITFIVPYNEYKRFVSRCLREVDYLATPTKDLLSYYKSGNEDELYSSYLRDMAVAICKELHYAESCGKDGTLYRHKSDGEIVRDCEYLHKVTVESDKKTQLRAYMSEHGFPLPMYFREKNHKLWEYANTLYYSSYYGRGEWEVSL